VKCAAQIITPPRHKIPDEKPTFHTEEIPYTEVTTHIGINRSSNNSPTTQIKNNLTKARCTLYSLMRAFATRQEWIKPS